MSAAREQIATACPCGGSGKSHHNASGDDGKTDALSYWTLCRDRDCMARRDAAFMGVSAEDIERYFG